MAKRLTSLQQATSVEEWLKSHYFQANPFADTEADRERRLADYFVETPYYEDILGDPDNPRSMVVFADRGCGKSAHRLMVSSACRPQSSSTAILAVNYTAFDAFSESLRAGYKCDPFEEHLRAILEGTVETFLSALFSDSALIRGLPVENVDLLGAFWRKCGNSANDPSIYFRLLRDMTPEGQAESAVDWPSFRAAWHHAQLGSLIGSTPGADHPGVRLLSDLVDQKDTSALLDRLSPTILFGKLVSLVQSTGIRAVYVLVDKVDESHMLAARPDFIVEMLVPLVGELPLMETPGAAFKMFLPTAVVDRLINRPEIRADRISFCELRWEEQTLRDLLSARLSAFSAGVVTSMGQLCEPDLAGEIELALIKQAAGVPRNLLRLAEELIVAHCQRAGKALLLSREDWRTALERYRGVAGTKSVKASIYPPLRLDAKTRTVTVGTQTVSLSDTHFKLLQLLAKKKGETVESYDLWQAGWSDASLRTAVKRIRQAIEPDNKNPIYLITVRGEGLRLENVLSDFETEASQ